MKKGIRIAMIYLLPLVYAVSYVAYFGVDIPQWDEWRLLDRWFDFKETGRLTLAQLFAPHNGQHIMLFPNMLSFLVLPLVHWNTKFSMYLSLVFLFAAYCILLSRLRSFSGTEKPMYVVGLAFICYSPVQWENLLWGFQSAWFMLLCFSLLSFFSFDAYLKNKHVAFIIVSAISVVIAAFCSLQGLALVVVYGGMLLLEILTGGMHLKKYMVFAYLFLIMICSICVAVYVPNIERDTAWPAFEFNIARLFIGFCEVGGCVFAAGYNFMERLMIPYGMLLGFGLSIVSLMALVYVIRNALLELYRFEIFLMAFSVLFRLMVAIGRSGIGLGYLLGSRYATFVLLNVISLFFIVMGEQKRFGMHFFQGKQSLLCMRRGFLVLFIAFVWYSFCCFYVSWTYRNVHLARQNSMLHYEEASEEELFMVTGSQNAKEARLLVRRIAANRYSAFHRFRD